MHHHPYLLYELAQDYRQRRLAQADAQRLSQLAVTSATDDGQRRFRFSWPRLGWNSQRQPRVTTTLTPSVN